MVTLTQPAPIALLPLLYQWLQEFPIANFDDYGPRNLSEFMHEMVDRLRAGERLYGVQYKGSYVGAIGYRPDPISSRLGMLHGICFCKQSHGSGVASIALSKVLTQVFDEGVSKVSAVYFADNNVVRRFLRNAGFVDEGYLVKHTIRDGKDVDMRLVAKFGKAGV